MTRAAELVLIELSDEELDLLRSGLHIWGGPVTCSEEMAVAMGFDGLADFRVEGERIRTNLWPSTALSKIDWMRALLATEVAFTSFVAGAAWDWRIVTGFDDPESLRILRSLQRKLLGAGALISAGTHPMSRPASPPP